MTLLTIHGPARIGGTITPGGNKNAVLPAIAAAVLTPEDVHIHNVPDIVDVRNMLAIIRALGGSAELNSGTLHLNCAALSETRIPEKLCHSIRTSLLFAGPLTARFGHAELGYPGGDMIGRRRFDTHFYGLRKLGIEIEQQNGGFVFRKGCFTPIELFLDEASVTATEHIMTTAAFMPGQTVILNAACEPHVQQLAELLTHMGATITGAGTNTIVINGKPALNGASLTIESDYVEVASYLALCAATGGSITIRGNIFPHNYWMTRRIFERFSCQFRLTPGEIQMSAPDHLHICPDLNNAIPIISDGPWPQFPSDMMSCMIAMATQSEGTVLFFEKMFESRLYFVDKLIGMGASAIVCDPHRVIISGPASLHGAELSSPDIRAGMAIVIAACCANGTSTIHNMDMVYRGYQRLPENLRSLGVNAKEEKE